jgi:hypothetical protein
VPFLHRPKELMAMDRRSVECRLDLDLSRGFVAAHYRVLDVHEDEVRPFGLCLLDTGLPIGCFDNSVARTSQKNMQYSAEVFLVLYDSDPFPHCVLFNYSARTGRSIYDFAFSLK